MTKSLRIYS